MYIIGGDDLNWPSAGMVEQSIGRLKAHGKDNYQVLTYPKAGHLIEPPYAPVCVKSYHKAWGEYNNHVLCYPKAGHRIEPSYTPVCVCQVIP